jgi:hypothetical protein
MTEYAQVHRSNYGTDEEYIEALEGMLVQLSLRASYLQGKIDVLEAYAGTKEGTP